VITGRAAQTPAARSLAINTDDARRTSGILPDSRVEPRARTVPEVDRRAGWTRCWRYWCRSGGGVRL